MALSLRQIDDISAAIVMLQAKGGSLVQGLREHFPDVAFVRCSAEDMDSPPFRRGDRFQLHLMDRSDVCIRLTAAPEDADGVIVAELKG